MIPNLKKIDSCHAFLQNFTVSFVPFGNFGIIASIFVLKHFVFPQDERDESRHHRTSTEILGYDTELPNEKKTVKF